MQKLKLNLENIDDVFHVNSYLDITALSDCDTKRSILELLCLEEEVLNKQIIIIVFVDGN